MLQSNILLSTYIFYSFPSLLIFDNMPRKSHSRNRENTKRENAYIYFYFLYLPLNQTIYSMNLEEIIPSQVQKRQVIFCKMSFTVLILESSWRGKNIKQKAMQKNRNWQRQWSRCLGNLRNGAEKDWTAKVCAQLESHSSLHWDASTCPLPCHLLLCISPPSCPSVGKGSWGLRLASQTIFSNAISLYIKR